MTERPLVHRETGTVIAAFPATGKTHLAERAAFVDSDSSDYSWRWTHPEIRHRHPDWPGNYIEHIEAELAAGRIVLVSTHAEVRAALVNAGLYFLLVYPRRELRAEYRQRLTARGSEAHLIRKVIEIWDTALDELEAQRGCDHLILGPGRYLSDVLTPTLEATYAESE